jgi:hypothetical protein
VELDPIPGDVREYLRQHFQDVQDEAREGDYYVSLLSGYGSRDSR